MIYQHTYIYILYTYRHIHIASGTTLKVIGNGDDACNCIPSSPAFLAKEKWGRGIPEGLNVDRNLKWSCVSHCSQCVFRMSPLPALVIIGSCMVEISRYFDTGLRTWHAEDEPAFSDSLRCLRLSAVWECRNKPFLWSAWSLTAATVTYEWAARPQQCCLSSVIQRQSTLLHTHLHTLLPSVY